MDQRLRQRFASHKQRKAKGRLIATALMEVHFARVGALRGRRGPFDAFVGGRAIPAAAVAVLLRSRISA